MKIRVFTDGACSGNPGSGGWAAIFNTSKDFKVLRGYEVDTTNNRMELTAVIRALEKILKSGSPNNQYEIYSDSAYVVNSINNNWVEVWKSNGWRTARKEDVKNKDLWSKYIDIMGLLGELKISPVIVKVKGHAGNIYNEYADGIAKQEVMKAKKYGGGRYD